MSRQAVETLMDKWMNDTNFRDEMRNDAESAIRGTNLELSTDEWEAVKNIEWSASDEELMSRANKAGPGN
ncbi:MAG TPA: Os1348 family NHLP clan protein [Pyrinomonadaceae bacterium]|nr:Os1348 family NHLP clan protein [Pyrinomonadaceae bacterium]